MATTRVFRLPSNTQLNSYLTQASASTTYVTKNSDSNYNVKLGTSSMKYLTTGEENVAIGHESIGTLSTGYGNVGVGFRSLSGNESGAYNVAIGYNSLYGPTGSNNIAIGQYAGNSIGNGNYNVVIGSNNGLTISNLNNNVIIADGQGNIRIQANSSGIVTTPSIPAVYAYSTVATSIADNGVLTFQTAVVNNGNHYNSGTSTFTAPVAGRYLVMAKILTNNDSGAADCRIAINGVRQDVYAGYSFNAGVVSSHKQGHVYGIVSLAANDTIQIRATGTVSFYGAGAGHSSLNIHLIG